MTPTPESSLKNSSYALDVTSPLHTLRISNVENNDYVVQYEREWWIVDEGSDFFSVTRGLDQTNLFIWKLMLRRRFRSFDVCCLFFFFIYGRKFSENQRETQRGGSDSS